MLLSNATKLKANWPNNANNGSHPPAQWSKSRKKPD